MIVRYLHLIWLTSLVQFYIQSQMLDGIHLRDIVSRRYRVVNIMMGSDNGSDELVVDIMDEDEAEEARKYVLRSVLDGCK